MRLSDLLLPVSILAAASSSAHADPALVPVPAATTPVPASAFLAPKLPSSAGSATLTPASKAPVAAAAAPAPALPAPAIPGAAAPAPAPAAAASSPYGPQPPPGGVSAPGPVPDTTAAAEPASSKDVLTAQLLDVTGVHGELLELGSIVGITMQYYLNKYPDAIPAKTYDDVVVVAEQAFDGKQVYAGVLKTLVADLDEHTMAAVLGWYKGEAGHHLHTLETAGDRAAGIRDLPLYLGLSQTDGLDNERLHAAHALDRAMFLSDDQVNIVMAVYRGARTGLNDLLPKARRLDKPALEDELSKARFAFRDTVIKAVLGGLVVTFQPAQVEDLAAYPTFVRTQEFQVFNRATARAIGHELERAGLKAAHEIAAYKPHAPAPDAPAVAPAPTATRALAGVAAH